MTHIAIVANKWWEAHPLCAVFLDERARPGDITDVELISYPSMRPPKPATRPADPAPTRRLSCRCGGSTVDIWCLEDLMNPFESSSSSFEKARVLPAALSSRPRPDLLIALGTAGSRPGVAANGSVVIGRRVFVHDPLASEPGRTGGWTPPWPDQVVDSPLPSAVLRAISAEVRYRAEARMLLAPIAPSPPRILVGNGLVSLGVVNITNYDQYFWADEQAALAFANANVRDGQIGSIETTHAVIRAATDSPLAYVSGIVDMEGLFDYQVTPRVYAQNLVGSHNAALATAFLLPEFDRQL